MPEVEESLSNVYFDSAASPFLYSASVFPTVTALAGAGRVLLGSDYPLLRARRLIDEARRTVASEDYLAAILGGNAERLLGARDGGRWCVWVTPIPSTGSGQALTFPHRGGRD